MLAVMKRTLLILFILLGLIGCTQQAQQSPTPKINSTLSSDFSTEFDRLFLSNEPLRYQDNVAFLEAIRLEELSSAEKNLIKNKLKQFLSIENQNREYASNSQHTGVASEIAFLRLQAIQVLAEVGTSTDVEFIYNLVNNPEREHPLFEEECKKAIEKLTMPQKTEEPALFQFPEINSIDSAIYDEIKETCRTYWDLNEMIKDTFEIRKDKTEYSIHCDGYSEGKLYHFVIRVDKNGKWINDGRSLKKS